MIPETSGIDPPSSGLPELRTFDVLDGSAAIRARTVKRSSTANRTSHCKPGKVHDEPAIDGRFLFQSKRVALAAEFSMRVLCIEGSESRRKASYWHNDTCGGSVQRRHGILVLLSVIQARRKG